MNHNLKQTHIYIDGWIVNLLCMPSAYTNIMHDDNYCKYACPLLYSHVCNDPCLFSVLTITNLVHVDYMYIHESSRLEHTRKRKGKGEKKEP